MALPYTLTSVPPGTRAAGQLIRHLHEGAFDTRPELNKATIETDFAGCSCRRACRAYHYRPGPYLVVHDRRDDQISALHIYLPMSSLMEQLAPIFTQRIGPQSG